MKLNYPKKDFLTYKESLSKFEDGEVPFEPFCVVEEKDFSNHGRRLIIGYRKDGAAILISDRTIEHISSKGEIQAYHVLNPGIKNYYKKMTRPTNSSISIFRKPVVGDTVMCVANGRYVGAVFGETYEVKEITHEGRLGFERDAQYTYEAKYFVVVSEIKSPVSINNGSKEILIGHMHDKKPYYSDAAHALSYAAMYLGNNRVVMGLDPAFKDFSDAIAHEDELILRKKLQSEEFKTRRVFDEPLIKRSKL